MPHWYPFPSALPASPSGPPIGVSGATFIRGGWDRITTNDLWSLYPTQVIGTNPLSLFLTYTLPTTPSPFRWHLFNLCTPPLKAQTLSGTIDLLLGIRTESGLPLFSWRICAWTARDFDQPRPLILDYAEAPGHELPVNPVNGTTAWGLSAPQALTPVTIEEGDYLIIEVGVIARNPNGLFQRVEYAMAPTSGPPPTGVAHPDLTPGSTATLTRAGWINFSNAPVPLDAPSNNSCATPIIIPAIPYADPMATDVRLATFDPATDMLSSCRNANDEGLYNTVWYRHTAAATGTLRIEDIPAAWPPAAPISQFPTATHGNTTITAYTGTCGALTEVACSVGYNGSFAMILLPVVAGTTYYVRIGLRFLTGGSHVGLSARYVTRPANDDLADAILIPALPFTQSLDTTLATMEAGEPISADDWTGNQYNSVWYKWVADSAPGNIRINTAGSEYDSCVTVWQRVPLSTFPLPPATNFYDTFNRPDAATLGPTWGVSRSWRDVGLTLQGQAAVTTLNAGSAPTCAGSYWDGGRYGPDCEFWGTIRGGFTRIDDWVEIDLYTARNPAFGAENGFWVGAWTDGPLYYAEIGRYNAGVAATLLATNGGPGVITGLGFRRLGTTLTLWAQRGGVWAIEATVVEPAHAVALYPQIGLCTSVVGSVAWETVGGGVVRSWQGTLWVEVFSAPWTNFINDEGDSDFADQANMVFRPTSGQTYYVAVFSMRAKAFWNNQGGGRLQLTLSRVTPGPPNQTCATALALGPIPHYATYSTLDAADGQMEIVPLGDCDWYTNEQNDSGKVTWFKWTADRTARMNFNTFGDRADVPLEIVVYTGSCGALVPIACGDFNWVDQASQFLIDAVLGTTYYFRCTAAGRIEASYRVFLDVDVPDFLEGDIVLSSWWMWVFTPYGALRRFKAVGFAPSSAAPIPTGSGIDPIHGLLHVASWSRDVVMRMDGTLVLQGEYAIAPGKTAEIPGFLTDGRLYVGYWGLQAGWDIDELVDPSFAIRRFDPLTGAILNTYAAKQERLGTAWLDPRRDQKTLAYTSRGRKVMAYDIEADAQLPDIVQLTDPFPAYRLRGIRTRPNDELLVADAAEVKRLSPAGAILQRYAIDARDDLNVIDQDADSTAMWVGDQDSSELYKVDIATGAVLLKVPGGPFYTPGYLCGITVVGGFRGGVAPTPPVVVVCINGTFPIDDLSGGGGPIDPPDPPDPPVCAVPPGTIMVGGWGDDPCLFLSPDGATIYPPPPSAPTGGSGLLAFCRLSTGDIGVVGGGIFPATGVGVFEGGDLTVLSEYTNAARAGSAITADSLGYFYSGSVQATGPWRFARLNAASQEIATWDLARPTDADYTYSSYAYATAVSEDGLTLYMWMTTNPLVAGDERNKRRILVFSFVGAGSYVKRLTEDFEGRNPGYGSLLVVPDGTGDVIAAFGSLNTVTLPAPSAIRRYRPDGTLVWTAGTPTGAAGPTGCRWTSLAHGLPDDTHFLAWAYDNNTSNSSGARYCWFSYATGAPDDTRNFEPEAGAFQVDSQFVVLAECIPPPPAPPPAPPPVCAAPAGTIMVGGWGDAPAFAYLTPTGALLTPPAGIPTFTGVGAFCRTSVGHIGMSGAPPHFPVTDAGLLDGCSLAILSAYAGTHAIPAFCIAADAQGYWYSARLNLSDDGGNAIQFARLDAASALVASWTIPLPPELVASQLWALAVRDDGLLAYVWMENWAITNPAPGRFQHRPHSFSLVGAGSLVGRLVEDFNYNAPGLGSLLVVPGSGDLIAAFRRFNGSTGETAIRRYTPAGALVWTAGVPAGTTLANLTWMCLAHGLPGDTHFLAYAYDNAATNSSGTRYCWFSYATGAPDNTRNFMPDNGAGFQFDSQFVVLAPPTAPPPAPVCVSGDFPVEDVVTPIKRKYSLSTAAGSYGLTGAPVGLATALPGHRTLAAVPEAYALTGAPVALTTLRRSSLALAPGSYALTGAGATFARPVAPGASLAVLVPPRDFTYRGSARLPQHQYITSAMAIRYRDVNGNPVANPTKDDVRHILVPDANAGLLIEYKLTGPYSLSTTAADLPALVETRRWANWNNYALLLAAYPSAMGAGASPSMFSFVHETNGLWYSWCPGYPGDPVTLPNLAYVILDDAEARPAGATSGVSVSPGHISDLFFFVNPSPDTWKDGTQGISPIPAALQARFGGKKYFTFGTNTSNTGPKGANGLGVWAIPDFPHLVTAPPPPRSNILTSSAHLYDTGFGNGLPQWQMHRPANMIWPGGNVVNGTIHYVSSGGVYSAIAYNVRPAPLSLGVNDCIYFTGGTLDTVNVRMTTPAAGGAYVVEKHHGGGVWGEPSDLALHTGGAAAGGSRAMTGTHNVFFFNSVTSLPSTPHPSMGADGWWRLRRTAAGSVPGNIYGIYAAHSREVGYTGAGGNRPDPVGGYKDHAAALAAYNADPTAAHAFCFAEYIDGACLVRTSVVEGLLFAGKFGTGPRWYGTSSLWARPNEVTGSPTHYVDSLYGPDNANGNWNFGTIINYMGVLSLDQLAEVVAGTRAGNAAGLNPVAYYRMRDHWNYPVNQVAVPESLNPGEVLDSQQTFGQAMAFDSVPVVPQVIYLWSRAGGSDPWMMVWDVRDAP